MNFYTFSMEFKYDCPRMNQNCLPGEVAFSQMLEKVAKKTAVLAFIRKSGCLGFILAF